MSIAGLVYCLLPVTRVLCWCFDFVFYVVNYCLCLDCLFLASVCLCFVCGCILALLRFGCCG